MLARPGGHRDGQYLRELIIKERITTLHFVPSMLRVFLEEEGLEQCATLQRVISSGEAVDGGSGSATSSAAWNGPHCITCTGQRKRRWM